MLAGESHVGNLQSVFCPSSPGRESTVHSGRLTQMPSFQSLSPITAVSAVEPCPGPRGTQPCPSPVARESSSHEAVFHMDAINSGHLVFPDLLHFTPCFSKMSDVQDGAQRRRFHSLSSCVFC